MFIHYIIFSFNEIHHSSLSLINSQQNHTLVLTFIALENISNVTSVMKSIYAHLETEFFLNFKII